MTSTARRHFLQFTAAFMGSAPLVGCSGGDPAEPEPTATTPPPAPGPSPEPSPPPPPAGHGNPPPPPPPSSGGGTPPSPPAPSPPAPAPGPAPTLVPSVGAMRFSLLSANSVQAAPFCVGFAFRKGDIPAGSTVTSAQVASLQVTARNTWPDGSLKFALIAGRVDLSAGVRLAINLRRASSSSASGAALNTASLRATGVTAEVACGSFGTVSWSGGDWDAPFRTLASGPELSSWVYRKPVGSDAHLVAWLEVRHYAGGSVEVLPWIENGYVNVAGPSNRNAVYRFTLGGNQRFSEAIDLKHHQRTPLIDGAALSYWNTTDPAVAVQHDALYLMGTELVPTYFATQGGASGALAALPRTYAPLQIGSLVFDNDNMASTGYQDPIGLLPQHDVLYLTGGTFNAYGAVLRNGFSAGRYGIHYRDETTNRPLRFSQHPTRVIADGQGFKDNGGSTTNTRTPTTSGGNPPTWDIAHSPSVGYMAYLVSGWWYFMEEVLFAATANYLGNGDNSLLRTGSQGLVQTAVDGWQTRSCAWDWRSRIQALTVIPDDDTALRNELIACAEANIAHFHGRYVAQQNNPYGLILPGESSYNGTVGEIAIWQQDFVTAVFGWALSLDLPVSATAKTNLAAFFQWKAKSAVMRLGTRSGWWYINAASYTIKTGTAVTQNSFTSGQGPWPASEAAFYQATYSSPPTWLGAADGVLAAEFDTASWNKSFWGNLQPAIAYAVRHGVPGAAEGYQRMLGASNWPALVNAFNLRPVWAVAPAARTPAWAVGAALNTWVEIAGTTGGGGAAINPWGTLVHVPGTGLLISPANGGHNDSSDNRVSSIDLLQDRPTWTVQIAPSSAADVRARSDYYADGKPISRHGYHHAHYIAQRGRVMLFAAYGWYDDGGAGYALDGHSVAGQWAWDPAGTYPRLAAGRGFGSAYDPVTGDVWTAAGWRWNQSANTWSSMGGFRTTWRWPLAYDPLRRRFFTLQFGDGQGYDLARGVVSTVFDADTGAQTVISFNASAALTQFIADAPTYAAMDYDPHNDRFLFYDGQGNKAGRVYVVTPNASSTWDMSILSLAGTAPGPSPLAGINGRLRYIPALRGFALYPQVSSNMFFFRTG